MIVKVQLSVISSDVISRVLIYDRTREFYYEGIATKEVKKLMQGQLKKYFTAEIVGYQIVLDKEVSEQNW